MIVSADRERRSEFVRRWAAADVVLAWTPLDVLRYLERDGLIATVVLSDVVGSANTTELAEFLDDAYPFIRIFSEAPVKSPTAAAANAPHYAGAPP